MAIGNFGELKAAILADMSGRSDITDALLEQFVGSAEDVLYQDLRIRFMETDASVTVTEATRTSALPSRWLEGRVVALVSAISTIPEYVTPKVYWNLHADRPVATPDVYTISRDNFIWGPIPIQTATATVTYYKRPASLSANSDTNGLFSVAPDLLKLGALIQGYSYIGDSAKMAGVAVQYQALFERVMAADRRDRYSGDTVVATTEAQRT